MKLTKEEAIRRHRMMWNWIAEETLSKKKCVNKLDAFKHFEWPKVVSTRCWCCEYDYEHYNDCTHCPIKWPSNVIFAPCLDFRFGADRDGLYTGWSRAMKNNDWRKAAYYAFYISMLPERQD